MPGGKQDSSKTRVAPVFHWLRDFGPIDWPRRLLSLAEGPGPGHDIDPSCDLTFVNGWWGEEERGLRPPVALLSWLIRHPQRAARPDDGEERRRLLAGDPATVDDALRKLRSTVSDRDWFILEGPTYPDAVIETPDALIVVEGKRTEPGPTTDTTWMPGRHQIWRHIDAAWEIRGRRQVFGLFIVGRDGASEVPALWKAAVEDALTVGVRTSLPHRGPDEAAAIMPSLLGVTTWGRVVSEFGLPASCMPASVDDLVSR